MAWLDVSNISFEEKLLWACVLRRAVFDYVLYRGSGKHHMRFQLASAFIFDAAEDEETGLSFEQVCGLFGWEPDYLRRLTRKLKRKDIKRLEATKFKDSFNGGQLVTVERSAKFKKYGAQAPLFPVFHYSRQYEQLFRSVRTRQPKRHVSFVPTMRGWATRSGYG